MIRVTAEPGRLTLEGHAGYAPAGQDIVCAAVSALMLALAAGEPSKGYPYPQHHPKVKFDESVLSTGAAVFVDCAIQYMKE